jgi:very-short-patch-repair endonuclease
MAQSEFRNGISFQHTCVGTESRYHSKGHQLRSAAVTDFVLGAARGSVIVLGGIDAESLRRLLDQTEPRQDGRVALFTPIMAGASTEEIVEQIIGFLAETARRLWPTWFTNIDFSGCRNDTLGLLAARAIARGAAKEIPGLSRSWTEEAARLALDHRLPRVKGTPPALEFSNLSLAISPTGLVLVSDLSSTVQPMPNVAPLVRALEWIAQASQGAVVALFKDLPPIEPPFDRILYGASEVISETAATQVDSAGRIEGQHEPWIAPWRGLPHPLSDIEKRLAQVISADTELAPLFAFNQFVDTIRGSRPKVDLVWPAGRLVVELDGYGSHGNRTAFMYDRHRDYELALSGYIVLRLANDEIAQDYGKAIEKIRDIVRLRRTQIIQED